MRSVLCKTLGPSTDCRNYIAIHMHALRRAHQQAADMQLVALLRAPGTSACSLCQGCGQAFSQHFISSALGLSHIQPSATASHSNASMCRSLRSQDPWCKPSPSLKHVVAGAAEARALELQQSLHDKSLRHEGEVARVAQERATQLSKLRQRHQNVDATKHQTSERRCGLCYFTPISTRIRNKPDTQVQVE